MCKEGHVFSGVLYKYKNTNSETYLEFHVGNHLPFTELECLHPFGGILSVCRPKDANPFIFGQEKSYLSKMFS